MIDYRYRFNNRDEMLDALRPLNMTFSNEYFDSPKEQVIQATFDYALDEIGEIPNYDGWHLNMRLLNEELDVSSLTPFAVYPDRPYRVWA